jgi:hypothetical protein
MNTISTPWLPADAFDPARTTGLVAKPLPEWSRHWFKSDEVSCAPASQDHLPGPAGEIRWRSIDGIASVALTLAGQSAVASAMLGCAIPTGPMQVRDRAILENLSATAADDLLARIAALAGLAGQQSKPTGEPPELTHCDTWDVSLRSGKRAFRLALTREAHVSMIKHSLPGHFGIRPEGISRGLVGQTIELTADLGRCAIPLSELQGLGCGDILILDRSAEDAVGVLIDGFPSPLRGTLENVEAQTCVMLTSVKDQGNA